MLTPGDIVQTAATEHPAQQGVLLRNLSGKTEWLVAAYIGIGAFEAPDLTLVHPADSEEAAQWLVGLQDHALSWDRPGAKQVLATVLNQLG